MYSMVIDTLIEERVRKILTDKHPERIHELPNNILIAEPPEQEDKKIPYRKIFEKYQSDYRSSEGEECRINEIAEKIAKECIDF